MKITPGLPTSWAPRSRQSTILKFDVCRASMTKVLSDVVRLAEGRHPIRTFAGWCIKTACVYFAMARLLFAALLWGQVAALPPVVAALRPVAYHLLMVGWVSQLIFGVVFWMFPRLSKEQPRGNERAAWYVYGALNLGLLLRLLAEPLQTINPAAVWGWLLVASGLLQISAGWVFVWNSWSRVKPLGAAAGGK